LFYTIADAPTCPVSSDQLHQTLHVVHQIHHANLDPGLRQANGTHDMTTHLCLGAKHMFDARPHR
ncbi:MAG: hypothetical protein ACYC7I_09030, partial [Gammaproteobacteria bacterium]